MRPVQKGIAPKVDYARWSDARDDLIDVLGNYCSYCESPPFMPDIEHKDPKSNLKYEHLALVWDNFLLACGYCNSLKGTKDTGARQVLFPDDKNTAWAFHYLPGGFIRVNPSLGLAEQTAAQDTRDWLLELNRRVDTNGNRDLRWQRRTDVWREAMQSRENLSQCDAPAMRRQIITAALGWGCFSVWMTVFEDDPEMRRALIAAFATVRPACYAADTTIVPLINA